ncbi:hypothetical protein KAR91_84305 [Candidatus Pacearchaeota archaeon]|nr:hypothetical protein [Candidatus Pacearchaeota archaeon]
MKKQAKDLEVNDEISIFGKIGKIEKVETSDIGKQGKKKVRIELKVGEEKTVLIRPEDYPFEVK